MIIRQSKDYTMWEHVVPSNVDISKRYVITKDEMALGFSDFQEADEKFCQLTGEPPFKSLLIKQI